MPSTYQDRGKRGASDHAARSVVRQAAGGGLDDLERIANEPRSANWRELHETRKAIRKIHDAVSSRANDAADDDLGAIEGAMDQTAEMVASLTDEIDERSAEGVRERDEISADPRRPGREDRSVPGGVTSTHREEGTAIEPHQRFADHHSIRSQHEPEFRGVDVGQYLRSMVLGPGNDTERRALQEGSDSAGGYSVPTVLASRLIDLMRARNTAIQAGAQTIPLESDRNHIAKLATDPVPGWLAEDDSTTASDPTFARVEFLPKTLVVLVRASRELLEDSVNISSELPNVIAAAMAQELDRVAFLGSGTGSEPTGLDNLADVQSIDHGASAIDDYTPFVQARRQLLNQNAERIGPWVMAPDLEEDIGNLTDSTGQPLRYPTVLDRPDPFTILTTSKLPTDLGDGSNEGIVYGGDFRQLAIGIRNQVRVETLRERYAEYLQYGFIAYLRADVAAIHPEQLIRITGITS